MRLRETNTNKNNRVNKIYVNESTREVYKIMIIVVAVINDNKNNK